MILVCAGNHGQFMDWCHEQGWTGPLRRHFIYVSPDAAGRQRMRGVRLEPGDDVVVVGTYWEQRQFTTVGTYRTSWATVNYQDACDLLDRALVAYEWTDDPETGAERILDVL